jgi:hypothetical protein
MSRAAPPPAGQTHPLARPFQKLSGKRTGLIVLAVLIAALVASFAIELLLTGGEGWSKYPDVLGGYEVLPALALAAAILVSWVVRGILSASADFYERRDRETGDAHMGGTVGAPADGPIKTGSVNRD